MVFKRVKQWYVDKVQKPVAGTMDEWYEWESTTRAKFPLKYFLFETFPMFFRIRIRNIKDFKYHIKQKYFRGYHCLKLDVKRFKYPYGKDHLSNYSWMDTDTQIELFMFQILVNYVEKELGYESLKEQIVNGEAEHNNAEAFELYEWFVNDFCYDHNRQILDNLYAKYPEHAQYEKFIFSNSKPKTQRERDYNRDKAIAYGRINDYDELMNQEMTKNLIRLVKIRGSLWT